MCYIACRSIELRTPCRLVQQKISPCAGEDVELGPCLHEGSCLVVFLRQRQEDNVDYLKVGMLPCLLSPV